MGSLETGELFTERQYQEMPITRREELKVVGLTEDDQRAMAGMNRKQRRDWMRKNKKFSKRQRNVQAA